MRVKELIDLLEECDKDSEVYLEGISSDIEVIEFENGTTHLYRKED
jgi:hypothetical protein